MRKKKKISSDTNGDFNFFISVSLSLLVSVLKYIFSKGKNKKGKKKETKHSCSQKEFAITFLIFLIILFSWVSFALSAILCASISFPAAEPPSPAGEWNAPSEQPVKSAHSAGYLPRYICTITALVFCCYSQHVTTRLLLKHHTGANKETTCELSGPEL